MQTPTTVILSAIPYAEQEYSDSGEEELPFNKKNPSAEPGSVQASICCDQLGVWEDREETQKEQKELMLYFKFKFKTEVRPNGDLRNLLHPF